MKKRFEKIIGSSLMAIFAVSGFSGCALFSQTTANRQAAAKAHPIGERYVVSAIQTPFYKFGPIQSGGADYVLKNGQYVTLARYDSDYSRVVMDGNLSGYVATSDISPAPAPKPTPTMVSYHGSSSSRHRSSGNSLSPANRAAVTDQLGPVPDLPTGKTPKFRY